MNDFIGLSRLILRLRSKVEVYRLLVCDAVWSDRNVLMFRMYLLLPFLRFNVYESVPRNNNSSV